jgi:Tol biopolymer transport system component
VGREADTDYLVMELVEGETLAQRLARGPLPTPEVLKLGAQIADALDRAHRAGVTHRDLKPGNVMLTRSGAKLMDFGLARATGLAGPSSSGVSMAALTQSPTVAQPLTAEGTIVGTFQYMAPEQLEGKEADARSDLWALGCVLYEMATGKRAFEGKSQASLITAIMGSEPPSLTQISPMSPAVLERLVMQCLAKDPDERWQSAGDVRRELEWIRGSSSQSAAPAVSARRSMRMPAWTGLAAGAVVAAAALTYAFGPWGARGASIPLTRFALTSPPGMLLNQPAEVEISPDGRAIVFIASDSGGTSHLFLRPFASPDARELPGTDRAALPFWSPDGHQIGFFAGGKLKKVALDGSAPVVLCDAPDGRGAAWSPQDVIVFAPNNQGPLSRVSSSGGAPTTLTELDAARKERGHRYPQWLPDGRHFLYVAIASTEEVSTFAASLEGGKPVEVCRGGSMGRFAPPGNLLFLDTGVNSPVRRVLARSFDPSSLRTSGDARLVLDKVNATNFGYPNLAADARGTLVAQRWSDPHLRMVWRDRRGALLGVAIEDFDATNSTLSPDGRRLAYSNPNPADLYVRDMTTGISRRLTFENQAVRSAVWSFDGRSVAFSRLFGTRGWEVRVKTVDGGPDSAAFPGQGLFNYPAAWSRDGRWLVVLSTDSSGAIDLWKVPMLGGGAPEIYQRTRGEEGGATLSPDGKWIAYTMVEDDHRGLYVQSFPVPGDKYQVTIDDPVGAVWGDRGDEIVVLNDKNTLYSIKVSTAGGFQQGATTRLFTTAREDFFADVERGEQRFLVGTLKDVSATTELDVVLGWPGLLERK